MLDGLFYIRDPETGNNLFTLTTNELPTAISARRLTLLLDVPCVPAEKEAFKVMLEYARTLCLRLDGAMIDDENQLLNDDVLLDISNQVTEFYREMDAYHIPAGSERALRLFN